MTTLGDLVAQTPRAESVGPDVSVREAAKIMASANVGSVVILERDRMIGLFTERDLLRRVMLPDLRTDETKVSEVMTREVISAAPELSAAEGARLLREHHIRHLPILCTQGELLGVLSIRDLLADEVQQARKDVAEVNRFIQGGEAFEGTT